MIRVRPSDPSWIVLLKIMVAFLVGLDVYLALRVAFAMLGVA